VFSSTKRLIGSTNLGGLFYAIIGGGKFGIFEGILLFVNGLNIC